MIEYHNVSIKRSYWPTSDWRKTNPEEQALDSTILDNLRDYLKEHYPSLYMLVIIKNGYNVFEIHNQCSYENISSKIIKKSLFYTLKMLKKPKDTFREQDKDCNNMRSATKSILSILLGIALDKHIIESIDEEVYKVLPDIYSSYFVGRKKDITIRHLVTMKSGLKSIERGFAAYKLLFCDGDWVKYILNLPLESMPGDSFRYNSANTHLLSAVISNLANMSTLDFAKKHLFEPLGISNYYWESDLKGYNFGGGNLFLSPYDMAKIGYLYINNGLWDDKMIISKEWIEESLKSYHVWDWGFNYGYLWYLKNEKRKNCDLEYITYSAAGVGGQRIFIIPDLDIVIAATSRTSLTSDKGYILNNSIGEFILPAVKRSN